MAKTATDSAAGLALIEGKPLRVTKPSKRDREFFLLTRRGLTTEQLAARYGLTELTVKAGLERYHLWRDSFHNDEIDLQLNEIAAKVLPSAQKVLSGAMAATINRTTTKGKKTITRKVADHTTRLKAVEVMKSLMEASRPKGGGFTLNQQINGGKGDQGPVRPSFSFEERVYKIREAAGLKNDDAIPDAEFEDANTTASEELAEIGIDIDDEDDDEEYDDDEDNE